MAHALRQARYRQRQQGGAKKVTHHGSNSDQGCGSVEEITVDEEVTCRLSTISRVLGPEIRCHGCGRMCGPLARVEFWRGGRSFPRLRRQRDECDSGDGGGDHSPFPR